MFVRCSEKVNDFLLREIRTLHDIAIGISIGINSTCNFFKALQRLITQSRICVKNSWTIHSDINWCRQTGISPGQNMVCVISLWTPAVGRLGQWVEERWHAMLEDINTLWISTRWRNRKRKSKSFFSYSSEDDFSSSGKSLKRRNKLDEYIRTICVYLRRLNMVARPSWTAICNPGRRKANWNAFLYLRTFRLQVRTGDQREVGHTQVQRICLRPDPPAETWSETSKPDEWYNNF